MANSIFDEINEELDIEFFLDRESIAYKKSRGSSGMQINVRNCPDCGDKRYRVYLNADSGVGNCFVCNQTFRKMTFIKHYLGLDSWKPVIDYCREVMKEQGWRPRRVVSATVDPGQVVLPYSSELPLEDGTNLLYLENRGITGDYAKYFALRWCEFGFWGFTDEDGKRGKQDFDNRIIIPVFDLDGTLMTFQGRDLTGKAERKYLFPKMLPGTGRYLYNGHNVHVTNEIVMGEGAFDVMAIKIAFDEEVALRHIVPVGSFGKHLSFGSTSGDDQLGRFLRLRRGGVKTVTIMWDGEPAALLSALNAAKLLTGVGLRARIALLPADKDPNEVPAAVVRQAYWKAELWTPALDIRWRLRNPYGKA